MVFWICSCYQCLIPYILSSKACRHDSWYKDFSSVPVIIWIIWISDNCDSDSKSLSDQRYAQLLRKSEINALPFPAGFCWKRLLLQYVCYMLSGQNPKRLIPFSISSSSGGRLEFLERITMLSAKRYYYIQLEHMFDACAWWFLGFIGGRSVRDLEFGSVGVTGDGYEVVRSLAVAGDINFVLLLGRNGNPPIEPGATPNIRFPLAILAYIILRFN